MDITYQISNFPINLQQAKMEVMDQFALLQLITGIYSKDAKLSSQESSITNKHAKLEENCQLFGVKNFKIPELKQKGLIYKMY